MKILAVADERSESLMQKIADRPDVYRDVDCILSCGDLDNEYLEFLAEGIGRDLFFIYGNHNYTPVGKANGEDDDDDPLWLRPSRRAQDGIAGRTSLHARVEPFQDVLLAGFNGSMWYNGKPNQYTEAQMRRAVYAVVRSVQWHQVRDRMRGRKPRDLIVISHAPPAGVHDSSNQAHRGFKCFHELVDHLSPVLWLHGHVHTPERYGAQISMLNTTTVINAYGCCIVNIAKRKIDVVSHCAVDQSPASARHKEKTT